MGRFKGNPGLEIVSRHRSNNYDILALILGARDAGVNKIPHLGGSAAGISHGGMRAPWNRSPSSGFFTASSSRGES